MTTFKEYIANNRLGVAAFIVTWIVMLLLNAGLLLTLYMQGTVVRMQATQIQNLSTNMDVMVQAINVLADKVGLSPKPQE